MWITLMAVFMLYGIFMTASSMHWQAVAKKWEGRFLNVNEENKSLGNDVKFQKARANKASQDIEDFEKKIASKLDQMSQANDVVSSELQAAHAKLQKLEKSVVKKKVGRLKKINK